MRLVAIMQEQPNSGRRALHVARARAAVLWAVLVLLGLQVAYHWPLSRWFPEIHDPEYANKAAYLRAHLRTRPKDQPFLLGLGSSFTGMGLRPAELLTCAPRNPDGPLVFNHAMNGSGVIVQLLCLNRLLAEGNRPDWVLVEASSYMLFDDMGRTVDNEYLSLPRVQHQDISVLARFHQNPHQLRTQWRRLQCQPWSSHRHLIQNWLLPSWIPKLKRLNRLWCHTDEWGWEAIPIRTPVSVELVRGMMESRNKLEPSKDIQRGYHELISLCQREQIGVVVIRVPESSYVRRGYSVKLNRNFEHFYDQLSARFGVRVVDASAWVEDADFVVDGLHLAPSGATVYTRRLEQEVIIPIAAMSSD
jgi:hypothetical protein